MNVVAKAGGASQGLATKTAVVLEVQLTQDEAEAFAAAPKDALLDALEGALVEHVQSGGRRITRHVQPPRRGFVG
jgi:hypothetical protein